MRVTETVQSLAELLGSAQGLLGLLAASVLTIATPFADRYLLRRKRLSYRVQYNSKIGLSPIDLRDDDGPVKHADPQLKPIAELLDRMTIVVIRIRNTGVEDIRKEDFDDQPLTFTFGGRTIWNARISEPSVEEHRAKLSKILEFSTAEDSEQAPGHVDRLDEVRTSLGKRMIGWFRPSPQAAGEVATPRWQGVSLDGLDLQRKERFKLVVVLREPESNGTGELTKDVDWSGHLSGGRIVNEKEQRRITWPRATATVGTLLAGVLLATLLANTSRPAADPALACGAGEVRVVGSSAFSPIMGNIADAYSRACGEAQVDTEPTGSIAGVRALRLADQDERDELAALSDGRAGDAGGLVARPLAVIVYASVVNDSAGVDELTLAQLRGIYTGRYRDWNELRRGPSLPIRIVGRGQESGSRRTFEQTVLGASEGALSSDSCERRDRGSPEPTIRCERSSEAEVLDEVAATDGAIGYVDLSSASAARAQGLPVTALELDGEYPDVNGIAAGYPFWTIEYLYTRGTPEEGSLLARFLGYLRSGTARDELQSAGYTPCVGTDGSLHPLCRG
ncbi:PstS family phosphate ABC transporter substrate-binding protein [Prauserella muralis]|uniref:Phosphate-binding protein n=1 Tax=Prauserella muralis TaxID=588067 RepID=A0A2V4B7A4_9PSEU|nr:substrate-binding domain-containing protein [Prauserella muralis]PXY31026.1 phosphate-binding protein [Prauserella muralis]TWE14703.1 ABC-type phosphate transport system substrate-binding protein [Prauserella muralis]